MIVLDYTWKLETSYIYIMLTLFHISPIYKLTLFAEINDELMAGMVYKEAGIH
jgi:hypothetical protein